MSAKDQQIDEARAERLRFIFERIKSTLTGTNFDELCALLAYWELKGISGSAKRTEGEFSLYDLGDALSDLSYWGGKSGCCEAYHTWLPKAQEMLKMAPEPKQPETVQPLHWED